MEEGKSLINIGELSKPATVLIEKISEAVGGVFRPYQIRRMAEAKADAERIKEVSKIEITDLQRRAMHRFIEEEGKKQGNIESITNKALPDVDETATPEKIENDWLANFFDKCRLISDDEMQKLWARVLAGEANLPGRFSKRTVALLGSLDKSDAVLFQKLCSFGWMIGDVVPLIYEEQDQIYQGAGIYFNTLMRLVEIGLISHGGISGFQRVKVPKQFLVHYYGTLVKIEFPYDDNKLDLGKVLLSKTGQELAPICDSKPCEGFMDYILGKWRSHQLKVEVMESKL